MHKIHRTHAICLVSHIIYIDSYVSTTMSLGMNGHSLLCSSEYELMCLFFHCCWCLNVAFVQSIKWNGMGWLAGWLAVFQWVWHRCSIFVFYTQCSHFLWTTEYIKNPLFYFFIFTRNRYTIKIAFLIFFVICDVLISMLFVWSTAASKEKILEIDMYRMDMDRHSQKLTQINAHIMYKRDSKWSVKLNSYINCKFVCIR